MKAKLHKSSRDLTRDHDVLLVLGDGDSMKSDLDGFLSWGIGHDVGAIGRCIKAYPGKVRHWFNADGETSIHWAKNLLNGNGTVKHTLGEVDGFDADWDMEQDDYGYPIITGEGRDSRVHGSSSLFATLAGIAMGYKKIVLAGCPLDMRGHWYFPEKRKETLGPLWLGVDFMAWIDFAHQDDSLTVRSMSGYTEKILGTASEAWVRA